MVHMLRNTLRWEHHTLRADDRVYQLLACSSSKLHPALCLTHGHHCQFLSSHIRRLRIPGAALTGSLICNLCSASTRLQFLRMLACWSHAGTAAPVLPGHY